MEWFRLYSEARNDAKLRSLNDGQFRVWFNLLCLAADQPERGVIEGRKLSLVAVECAGGDLDLLVQTLDLLSDLDILHCEGLEAGAASPPRLAFIHFNKRQYTKPSDRPERVAERVSRQKTVNRAESRGIALDTETDTETESEQRQNRTERTPPLPPQAGGVPMRGMEERVSSKAAVTADLSESQCIPSRTEYSARFERFWREEYPRHDAKITAWRAWKRLGLETDDALLRRIVKDVRVRRKEPRWCENDGAFIPQLTSYLNGRRWEDERTSPAQQPSPASKAGSSYGSRNAPFVPESQPISYAAYRKRLEDSRHIARAEQVLAS